MFLTHRSLRLPYSISARLFHSYFPCTVSASKISPDLYGAGDSQRPSNLCRSVSSDNASASWNIATQNSGYSLLRQLQVFKLTNRVTVAPVTPVESILPSRIPSSMYIPIPPVITTITDPETTGLPSSPISCPLMEQQHEIRATNRMKRQRRKHCRMKNKKQRMKKLRHVIMKNQDEREAAKEAQFRKEMSTMLKKALAFNAEQYVRDTIARSKWEPTPDNTETRRSHIFWSEFMTVEQLYGVPDDDYINKKDGFAGEEDWNKILELREKYNNEYKRKK